MNIEYLNYLQENPERNPGNTEYSAAIEPIPLSEIEELETKYNNGDHFPKALRELLYLAGKYCYVLDYGGYESQDKLQQSQRDWMEEDNMTFNRNFYIVDLVSDYENFCFVYTDEGNNPMVYHFSFEDGEIYSLKKLKEYINESIDMGKAGLNPF